MFDLSLIKDRLLMSTTLFSDKDVYRKNDIMEKHKLENDAARTEFIDSFKKNEHKEFMDASSIIKEINQGAMFGQDPIEFMDRCADQDDLMISIAICLANGEESVRKDYLTNKFIRKLNRACEYLGFPRFIDMTDEELSEDREIVFDDPDYSESSLGDLYIQYLKDLEESEAKYQKIMEEAKEYNRNLRKTVKKDNKEKKSPATTTEQDQQSDNNIAITKGIKDQEEDGVESSDNSNNSPPKKDGIYSVTTQPTQTQQINGNNFSNNISGRFTKKEINGRSDQQLIQDAMDEACSILNNVKVNVTPSPEKDKYVAYVTQNGVVVDTFTCYGSTIMGAGVPVLEGNAIHNGLLIPFFAPIKNIWALRTNIFRNVAIKNINGDTITGASGTDIRIAKAILYNVCKELKTFDYLDLSSLTFTSDDEASRFFHTIGGIFNLMLEMKYSLGRYRVCNYKNPTKFELIGDLLASKNMPEWSADTFSTGAKRTPPTLSPDNRKIKVSGKNVIIYEPDGKQIHRGIKI